MAFDELVVIRGAGDLGSGVALRLWRAGFQVALLEAPEPVAVRRTVAAAEAVYDRETSIEEMRVALAGDVSEALEMTGGVKIPILVDPFGASLPRMQPYAVVDAIMAKRNTGTNRGLAPLTVGLGPGFTAGEDVHAVVETNRGPDLGRVMWQGRAASNTGSPGEIGGHSADRVLRAPSSGRLSVIRDIGEVVDAGDIVATVGAESVRASFRALVRGMARSGLLVTTGMKVGDLDPRLDPSLCSRVSDKALAVAGGVLEAVLIGMR